MVSLLDGGVLVKVVGVVVAVSVIVFDDVGCLGCCALVLVGYCINEVIQF